MDTSLYVGLSAQVALQRQFDVVAHNIANANTTGFKAERVRFEDVLQGASEGGKVAFALDRESYLEPQAGHINPTGNDFDIAIQSDGWLLLETPQGVRYTRDGRFALDNNGVLVQRQNGYPVLDEAGGHIIVNRGSQLFIASDGTLTQPADQAGEASVVLGRLGLLQFDAQQLTRNGEGLYGAPEFAGQPVAEPKLTQGALESSNVEPIKEMVAMMALAQANKQAGEFVNNGDELKRDAITRLGRT